MADRKWPRATQKMMKGMRDPAGAAALTGLIFDFVVEQPINRYVDGERLLGHLDRGLDEALVEEALKTHWQASMEREHERAKARGDTVKDWLTAEAQAELRSLAAKPVDLDRALLEKLVAQDTVQHMLQNIIKETLDRFVSSLKGSGGGGGGGVARGVGRAAFGFAKKAAGGGILGAIGGQVEEQLRRGVRTFVDSSMNVMRERVVAILSSQETARMLGRNKLTAYEKAMETPTAKITKGSLKTPVEELAEIIPGVIVHNLQRPEIRQGILDEVVAWLEIEGEKSVREALGPEENVAALRAELVGLLTPMFGELMDYEPYLEWLGAHS